MNDLCTTAKILPISGCFIAANVTVHGESIVVEPENIHKAIAALLGSPIPGMRVKVMVEYEVMTDAAFNSLDEIKSSESTGAGGQPTGAGSFKSAQ